MTWVPAIRSGSWLVAALVLSIWTSAPAQVLLHSDSFAFSGAGSLKNVVRDAEGSLYCVSIQATDAGEHQLVIRSSGDGGETWEEEKVLNDESSGLNPPQATNGCAVAIDDRDTLHVTWARYYYPSSYRQLYRSWSARTGEVSEVFDVSAWTGAARTARTAAMSIAVDEAGLVWLVAHGPQSWAELLAHSVEPYAAGLEFVNLGRISPSASAQWTQLAIDSVGRVHCSFYRNIGNGQYEHRIFDPLFGWGESVNLGNESAPNDYWGSLASDSRGNVHVLFVEDATSSSLLWRFRYRRWEEGDGWGPPTTLYEAALDEHAGIANYRIVTLGCDESSGDVTVLYRDLTRGGALGFVSKESDDDEFGEFHELAPPTDGLHEYYAPTFRGSLYPQSNNTRHGRHVTWQHRSGLQAPLRSLLFNSLDGTEPLPAFRRGEADGSGRFDLSDAVFGLAALFLPGSPAPSCLDAADSNDDGRFNLSDAVYSLNALFSGGPPPPPPGADSCAADPTDDNLGCERYGAC